MVFVQEAPFIFLPLTYNGEVTKLTKEKKTMKSQNYITGEVSSTGLCQTNKRLLVSASQKNKKILGLKKSNRFVEC